MDFYCLYFSFDHMFFFQLAEKNFQNRKNFLIFKSQASTMWYYFFTFMNKFSPYFIQKTIYEEKTLLIHVKLKVFMCNSIENIIFCCNIFYSHHIAG